MPFSTLAKNSMLDTLLGNAPSNVYAGLVVNVEPTTYTLAHNNEITYHSDPPLGASGNGRQRLDLQAASNGAKRLNAMPQWNVAGGQTIVYVTFWKNSNPASDSDVNYLGYSTLAFSETFSGNGTYTLTDETFQLNG